MELASELPIIQAPMAGGPSTPELTVAVARAGGFGFTAAGYLTPDQLVASIARTRARIASELASAGRPAG